jgi:hypothetical protein
MQVSCIAAEIQKDATRTDWDADCFTKYRELLEQESIQPSKSSGNGERRGPNPDGVEGPRLGC